MPKCKRPEEQFKRSVQAAEKARVDASTDQLAASFQKIAVPTPWLLHRVKLGIAGSALLCPAKL